MISIASSQLMKQPMYFSELPLPRRPLLHLHCDLRVDRWLAGSKEDHFLPWLHDTALRHALLWGWSPPQKKGGLHPPGDDLWSLGGHLQASALQSDHDQTEVCCHDCCFLRWAFLCSFGQFLVSFSLSTVLWPQGNRSLLLPWVSVAETGLHWQHQNRSPGHRRFGPHGPGDFCGLVDILLYPTPLAVPTSLWWFCFFAPLFYVYFRPVTTWPEGKVFPLLCTIIAPMLNPLIYTVRNFEMKNSIKKL